jgi:hypothetical protein
MSKRARLTSVTAPLLDNTRVRHSDHRSWISALYAGQPISSPPSLNHYTMDSWHACICKQIDNPPIKIPPCCSQIQSASASPNSGIARHDMPYTHRLPSIPKPNPASLRLLMSPPSSIGGGIIHAPAISARFHVKTRSQSSAENALRCL